MTQITRLSPIRDEISDNWAAGSPSTSATLYTPLQEGDLLVALVGSKSGSGPGLVHEVSDSNGGTWTNINFADFNGVFVSAWYLVADADYVAADTTPNVTADEVDGETGLVWLQFHHYRPSEAYAFDLVEEAIDDSGTSHWDDLTSGNTAGINGTDLFVLGYGFYDTPFVGAPENVSLVPQNEGGWQFDGGVGGYVGFYVAHNDNQNSGPKGATVNSDGFNTPGAVGVAVFRNTTYDLTADSISFGVTLSEPTINRVHNLAADDIALAAELTTPTIGQIHPLNANDITLGTSVSVPTLTHVQPLTADDLTMAVQFGVVEINKVITPTSRIATVSARSRSADVPARSRTATVR